MTNPKQLYRSCSNRIIGGVAGGVGEYFDVDSVIVRLIFVLLAFPGGIGILFYIIAWIIIPEDQACASGKDIEEEIRDKADEIASKIKSHTKNIEIRRNNDGRIIVGTIIAMIGVLFLIQNVVGYDAWSNFWPIILIIAGLIFIFGNRK